MKGIVLAGGHGTRLDPLTRVTNKHLLPVYDQPMVHYPIRTLVDAGIDDILIVTNREHQTSFETVLGDGASRGVRTLAFGIQEGAGGIADALKVAEPFAAGDRVCVVLGDNIVSTSVRSTADAFARQASGARVLLKEVADPERFGVARVEGARIMEIIEKPAVPPSPLAVTGIYFYDADVFTICRSLRPSARGELEITDVNNAYLQRGDLEYDLLAGAWTDAGTFESLHRAGLQIADERARDLARLPFPDAAPPMTTKVA